MYDCEIKLKSVFRNKPIFYVGLFIGIIWPVLYLYFVSSSHVPTDLPDYEQELNTETEALKHDLNPKSGLNHDANELANTYQILGLNEVCRHDFSNAKKYLQCALLAGEGVSNNNNQNLAKLYLDNANLNREIGQLNSAKNAYGKSIDELRAIAFEPNFGVADFNVFAINYNNLGIIYFLMGQQTGNFDQKAKYYRMAKDYFTQAQNLIYVLGVEQNKSLINSIDDNLKECRIEIQHLH